jgi:N-methylhydantoinase B
MSKDISALQLGIVWRRLSGLMDEVAQTFVRTSFSVVVRENWDLACSLMDADGRVFAQSSRSIPSFLGTMPRTLQAMLQKHPQHSLEPGDVLISNDPWLGTGHLNDITMVRPIFRGRELVAFVGSTFHTVDIGGAPSPFAKDSYEEGLCIPILKIVRRGEENTDVISFLQENCKKI